MALDNRQNFSKAITTTGHTAAQTSITLNAGQGANLPDPTVREYNVTWFNLTDFPDPSDDPNREIVRVTAKVGDVLTVTRAQEGTTATDKNLVGRTYQFSLTPTKKFADDVEKEIQDGTLNYAIATGTADAIILTLDPAPAAYVDGATFSFLPPLANLTATPTLNVNGLGAITIVGNRQDQLFQGQIRQLTPTTVQYKQSVNLMFIVTPWLGNSDLYNNSFDFGTTTGVSNNYTFAHAIDPLTLLGGDFLVGSIVRFKAHATNTGASTFTISGFTSDIVRKGGVPLDAGDIEQDDIVELVKVEVGTAGDWQLMSSGAHDLQQRNFVFAYDTTTQSVAVANTFQDVTFNTNGEIDGWTHTAGSANFTANATEKYKVDMNFVIQKITGVNSNMEFIALFNGTEVAGSQVSELITVNNQPMGISKSFILDTTATQIFKIQMTSTTVNAEITTNGANALTAVSGSVTITRV